MQVRLCLKPLIYRGFNFSNLLIEQQGAANSDGKNTNADTDRGSFVDRQGNIGKYRIILQGKDTLDQKYYVPDGY